MALFAVALTLGMCVEHDRWERGHGFRPTPTPEVVVVEVPVVGTVATGDGDDDLRPSPTSVPTAAPGPVSTPWPQPTPEIIYRQLPPYPCLWLVVTAQVSVDDQLSEAAQAGVLACDPDSAVVPRHSLELP